MINLNEVSNEDANTTLEYNSLSAAQKQKYDYLFPIYEDEATTVRLVSVIEGRGRNSWVSVYEKITNLTTAPRAEANYHDALSDSFKLDRTYTSSDITGIVAEVRRQLGKVPYLTRLKMNCEADFFNLFIVKDVYMEVEVDDQVKRVHSGYKPLFKLKPID